MTEFNVIKIARHFAVWGWLSVIGYCYWMEPHGTLVALAGILLFVFVGLLILATGIVISTWDLK